MSAWHLQSAKDSMLHLDQQVQTFLKCIRGKTKDPTNKINALTSVNLVDATPQA